MEYLYSKEYDSEAALEQGCWSTLPIRIHKDEQIAIDASYEFLADWEKVVGKGKDLDSTISLCPNGHFVALTVPECLPERLRLVTRLSDFSYVYDDLTETLAAKEADNSVAEFGLSAQYAAEIQQSTKKKQLQASMMLELMEMDKDLAEDVLKAWGSYYKTIMTKIQPRFETVNDFIPWRVENAGVYVYAEMMAFGTGIKLTDSEKKLTAPVCTASVTALTIGNDFWSWRKEYDQYLEGGGRGEMKNAVYILMKQHKVGPQDAMELCKQLTIEWEQKCLKLKAEVEASKPQVSENVLRYLDACVYMASGSLLWHCTAPRYHGKQTYSAACKGGIKPNGNPVQINGKKRKFAPVVAEPIKGKTRRVSLEVNESLTNGVIPPKDIPEITASANGVHPGHVPNVTKEVYGLTTHSSKYDDAKEQQNVKVEKQHVVNGANGANGTHRIKLPAKNIYEEFTHKEPSEDIVCAPFEYLTSLPSKGVRDLAMQALNLWYQLPPKSFETIKSIISMLHNASLMLDDIEDGSALRRGKPTTHSIFGNSQTINSANYLIARSMREVLTLRNPKSLDIFTDELLKLYSGQSFDLYWTHSLNCPSEEEYVGMIDNKTGGLFRLLSKLMQAESTASRSLDLERYMTLLGRYFQIRDDYQNLMSSDYSAQKGFCEDLDEGKFSLPLIHTLQHFASSPSRMILEGIFIARSRTTPQHASRETKLLILEMMREAGSLEFTLDVLRGLEGVLDQELGYLESQGAGGERNSVLRLLLGRLRL